MFGFVFTPTITRMTPRRYAHIVNPVSFGVSEDLDRAQPITFAALRKAREAVRGKLEVDMFSAQFPEDRLAVPSGLYPTRDLDRSAESLYPYRPSRAFPLIRDILDRLYEASSRADVLIYSNIDIVLRPDFYLEVDRRFEAGVDALVVNRMNVPGFYTSPDQLPCIFREPGNEHPGHDCFVFKRELYPKFQLPDSILGIGCCFRPLLLNCICFADCFEEVHASGLTLHVGGDEQWQRPEWGEHAGHNHRQVQSLLQLLDARGFVPDHKMMWRFFSSFVQPAPLPKEAMRAQLSFASLPWTGERGDSIHLDLQIQNTSQFAWPAGWKSHVQVGLSLCRSNGEALTPEPLRIPLPETVRPGKKVTVSWEGEWPLGELVVGCEVDLVQENVGWFSQRGETRKVRAQIHRDGPQGAFSL